MSSNWKRKIGYLVYGIIFLMGIVLLLLPSTYFDEGQSMCVSVVLFDMECYGCGMTRAIQHLIHLDIVRAFALNKLSLIVFPLMIYLYFSSFWKFHKKQD